MTRPIFLISFVLSLHFFAKTEEIPCFPIKNQSKVYRCLDQSVSYLQPKNNKNSLNISSWNGLCGAVAASNVFHAYCQDFYPVKKIYEHYLKELIDTPGIRPHTLTYGLNQAFHYHSPCPQGQWKYYYTRKKGDFLYLLKKRLSKPQGSTKFPNWKTNPVIVLISKKGNKSLHYITVVNIETSKKRIKKSHKQEFQTICTAYYNEYGTQKSTSCDQLALWASQANNSIWTKFFLKEYNYIAFNKQ